MSDGAVSDRTGASAAGPAPVASGRRRRPYDLAVTSVTSGRVRPADEGVADQVGAVAGGAGLAPGDRVGA